jgi:hypothetical protein
MSVVDGKEWESLKRYNPNELYRLAREEKGGKTQEGGGAEEKESKTEESLETKAEEAAE